MRRWVLPPAAVLPHARGWLRRGAALALIPGLLQATTGCTLVGVLAGSQVPRYEPVSNPRDLPEGESVEVDATQVTWKGDGTVRPAPPLRGKLVENTPWTMAVRTDSGAIGLVDRRDAVEVKAPSGNYGATGAAIGLGIDATIVLVAIVVWASSYEFHLGHDSHWEASARGAR